MNKITLISIFVAIVLIVGSILLVSGDKTNYSGVRGTKSNVSIEKGKQIIEISARGGYSPRLTEAQAGIPTIIRMKTTGTFDCSSSLVIPKIGYRQNLPMTGILDVPLDPQKAGSEITGLCAMGMYNFSVKFN